GRDEGSDRRGLRDPGAQGRQAGARRLLGRVVRAVPPGGADPRGDQRRARRQDRDRQDERRREPGRPLAVPGDRHPDDERLPPGRGRQADRRRPPQGGHPARARRLHRL
ncbi:MAG: Thioredoxin, partial [uncultured Nocardioidaceae bacterium]